VQKAAQNMTVQQILACYPPFSSALKLLTTFEI